MDLPALMQWLSATGGSVALRESLYAYPVIESLHVLAIMLFVGTIAMVDLRLLGRAFPQTPVSEMTSRILPWTVAGFALMVVTGLLLFYAIPVRTYHSVWFRLKVVLILVAFANIWFFHRRVQRDQAAWDLGPVPPLGARVCAIVSLACWASVITVGRMIAYNWFDCDRSQPALVAWFAQCSAYVR